MNNERYEDSYLYRLRHSAAHLMAQALTELYPGIKLTIGPPIENGFYYDVDPVKPIREEELTAIEAKMMELAKLDQRIIRKVAQDRDDAKRIILEECSLGQGPEVVSYKLELLEAVPDGQEISFYDQQRTDRSGTFHHFIDLCRGPHVDSTKEIKSFKLMHLAGAYWRGDSKNKQLTRIYGTAFETKEELETYLKNLEEARKRDHRILGKELGLFMFSPRVGTGLPLWLPKGTILRETLVNFMKSEQLKRGYDPVTTPHIANIRLYEKSGHILTFREKMFPFMEDEEKETYILKPMNCPFHIEIYASQIRSYRDLPVRYAEFGTVHRYEQSGEVTGILRARGFTQDDAHLFVRPDQLVDEFIGVVDLMKVVLKKLGLHDFRARLGTKDPASAKYVGSDENWELATAAIETACKKLDLDYFVSPGDAAFYGPKLDLMIKDALGREWQMGTVQVDYSLPERFDLEYIAEDGKPHRPIMIHRAPFGSLERMIGLLTEQYAGAFPLWMAPVQVAVLPIADNHLGAAFQIAEALRESTITHHAISNDLPKYPQESLPMGHGLELRANVDERSGTIGKKIRENQLQKVPYMLIVGDRDIEAGTVGVRSRDKGDLGAMTLSQFIELVRAEI